MAQQPPGRPVAQLNFTGTCALVKPSVLVASDVTTFGRMAENNVVLFSENLDARTKAAISRSHCQLEWDATTAEWYLVDLGSTNGTFVNRYRLRKGERHIVKHGDILNLGGSCKVPAGTTASGELKLSHSFEWVFHLYGSPHPTPSVTRQSRSGLGSSESPSHEAVGLLAGAKAAAGGGSAAKASVGNGSSGGGRAARLVHPPLTQPSAATASSASQIHPAAPALLAREGSSAVKMGEAAITGATPVPALASSSPLPVLKLDSQPEGGVPASPPASLALSLPVLGGSAAKAAAAHTQPGGPQLAAPPAALGSPAATAALPQSTPEVPVLPTASTAAAAKTLEAPLKASSSSAAISPNYTAPSTHPLGLSSAAPTAPEVSAPPAPLADAPAHEAEEEAPALPAPAAAPLADAPAQEAEEGLARHASFVYDNEVEEKEDAGPPDDAAAPPVAAAGPSVEAAIIAAAGPEVASAEHAQGMAVEGEEAEAPVQPPPAPAAAADEVEDGSLGDTFPPELPGEEEEEEGQPPARDVLGLGSSSSSSHAAASVPAVVPMAANSPRVAGTAAPAADEAMGDDEDHNTAPYLRRTSTVTAVAVAAAASNAAMDLEIEDSGAVPPQSTSHDAADVPVPPAADVQVPPATDDDEPDMLLPPGAAASERAASAAMEEEGNAVTQLPSFPPSFASPQSQHAPKATVTGEETSEASSPAAAAVAAAAAPTPAPTAPDALRTGTAGKRQRDEDDELALEGAGLPAAPAASSAAVMTPHEAEGAGSAVDASAPVLRSTPEPPAAPSSPAAGVPGPQEAAGAHYAMLGCEDAELASATALVPSPPNTALPPPSSASPAGTVAAASSASPAKRARLLQPEPLHSSQQLQQQEEEGTQCAQPPKLSSDAAKLQPLPRSPPPSALPDAAAAAEGDLEEDEEAPAGPSGGARGTEEVGTVAPSPRAAAPAGGAEVPALYPSSRMDASGHMGLAGAASPLPLVALHEDGSHGAEESSSLGAAMHQEQQAPAVALPNSPEGSDRPANLLASSCAPPLAPSSSSGSDAMELAFVVPLGEAAAAAESAPFPAFGQSPAAPAPAACATSHSGSSELSALSPLAVHPQQQRQQEEAGAVAAATSAAAPTGDAAVRAKLLPHLLCGICGEVPPPSVSPAPSRGLNAAAPARSLEGPVLLACGHLSCRSCLVSAITGLLSSQAPQSSSAAAAAAQSAASSAEPHVACERCGHVIAGRTWAVAQTATVAAVAVQKSLESGQPLYHCMSAEIVLHSQCGDARIPPVMEALLVMFRK